MQKTAQQKAMLEITIHPILVMVLELLVVKPLAMALGNAKELEFYAFGTTTIHNAI